MAARALFVLDSQGVVNWSYLSPSGINPGADGILAALDVMANSPATASSGPIANQGSGSQTGQTTTKKERVRTS